MKRRFFYVVLACWVIVIRVGRWLKPRPFRMVLIRARCASCRRRLRPTLQPRRLLVHDEVLPVCRRCSTKSRRRAV